VHFALALTIIRCKHNLRNRFICFLAYFFTLYMYARMSYAECGKGANDIRLGNFSVFSSGAVFPIGFAVMGFE